MRSTASSIAAALSASIVSGFSTTTSAPASRTRTMSERVQIVARGDHDAVDALGADDLFELVGVPGRGSGDARVHRPLHREGGADAGSARRWRRALRTRRRCRRSRRRTSANGFRLRRRHNDVLLHLRTFSPSLRESLESGNAFQETFSHGTPPMAGFSSADGSQTASQDAGAPVLPRRTTSGVHVTAGLGV